MMCRPAAAVCAVSAAFFSGHLETAQAFSLSVYGGGGYDMVSSQSDAPEGQKPVYPEPAGPSYGLGVSAELRPFGPVGLAFGLGLSGFHNAWESEQVSDRPGGIVISSLGAGLGADVNFFFGGFVVGAGGSFHYGLSDTYNAIINEPAQTLEFDVSSLMRFEGHIGVGYTVAGLTFMGRFGGGAYMVSLVPPSSSEEVQDVYTGLMFGLVVSYRIIGPEPSADAAKPEEVRRRSSEQEQKKKKKKRKPRKRQEG